MAAFKEPIFRAAGLQGIPMLRQKTGIRRSMTLRGGLPYADIFHDLKGSLIGTATAGQII